MKDKTQTKLAHSIARNLFAARVATGLSQGELAAAAKTSRATIAQLESADGNPTLSTLCNLADTLSTTVLMLVIDRDEMDVLAMVASGVDLGRSQEEVAELEEPLSEMEVLHESGLSRSRRTLARMGASSAAGGDASSMHRRVGAAIGSAIAPGFGTELGAVLNSIEESLT